MFSLLLEAREGSRDFDDLFERLERFFFDLVGLRTV
jgi:hypothetical protein